MAEIWGAVTAAVIAGGAAVYSANQQKKSAAQANAALAGAQGVTPGHVPFPTLVNTGLASQKSIAQNLSNLPQDFKLANQVNLFNDRQAIRGYSLMQPYFQQLQAQLGANALSFAKGELPSDVVNSIGRASASRGLASGFGQGANGGQGALGTLNLRNLGLTSLDLSKYGNQLGQSLTSQAASLTPGLFDPTSQFVTPGLELAAQQFNAGAINQTNQLNAGYANAANTQNVGLQNAILQQQAQNTLAANNASANQFASGASTAASLAQSLINNYSTNNGGFYGSQAGAQNALSQTGSAGAGASVTNSPYGYAIRPAMV